MHVSANPGSLRLKLRKMCVHYSEEHARTNKSQVLKPIADRVFYLTLMSHREEGKFVGSLG